MLSSRKRERKRRNNVFQMAKTKKHPIKKWEVSIMELQDSIGKKFKVTRRLAEMLVAETKMFKSKKKAKKQFDNWLK